MSKVATIDVLKAKGLLVKLTRKKLNHNKMDCKLSQELVEKYNSKCKTALRVNKTIIPKSYMDPVTKITGKLSTFVYGCTVPWDEQGWRLLAIDQYKPFVKKVKLYTSMFSSAVVDFTENITEAIEEAKVDLGGAFKKSDYSFISNDGYVKKDEILKAFDLKVDYDTVSGGTVDVRATLTDAERKNIEDVIVARIEDQFAESQKHLFRKLYDVIEKLHERLITVDATWRDSIVGNISDLVKLLPKMNVAGDETLNLLAEKASKDLCRFSAEDLRQDKNAAKVTEKKAAEILDGMQGMI